MTHHPTSMQRHLKEAGLATHKTSAGLIDPTGLRGSSSAVIWDFLYGSQLSTGTHQNALTYQPASQQAIDPIEIQESHQEGVGFALHPAAETPIAIQPVQTGKGGGGGQSILLKPGQVHYPSTTFRGFTWGKPWGWLGGGLAHLIVIKEHGAHDFWAGNDSDIIFHKINLPIFQPGNVATLPPNFPLRFPWKNAVGQLSPKNPSVTKFPGTPRLNVTPTRTLFRLRQGSNTHGGDVTRLLFVNTDQFNSNGQGVNVLSAEAAFLDIGWPAYANSGFTVAAAPFVEEPVQTLTADVLRMGGDNCALAIIDIGGNAAYNGSTMDVIRYGKLGGTT